MSQRESSASPVPTIQRLDDMDENELLAQWRRLHERSEVLVACYDGFDRLRYANPAFRSAFFLDPDETPIWSDIMRRNRALGRGTVIREPDFEKWLISTQSRRGKVGFRAFETDLADGRWLWMTETVQPDGWMLCIASDVTAFRPDERAIRQDRDFAIKASNTDELTGVANRRFVTARCEEMLLQTDPASGTEGCICVLDLDNFKYVNDRFGHQMGDTVLRDFARRIQEQVRRTDCFGRIGGEEFMLVLPSTPIAQAALIVERMLAVVRTARPFIDRPDFGYTFSAGIAAGLPEDTTDRLYRRADEALYLAKIEGRNCIRLEQPGPSLAAAG